MGRLDGRTVVVTGGAKGLGKGMARRLAREGAAIVIADIDEAGGNETLEAIAKDYGVKTGFRKADVGLEPEARGLISSTVSEFGKIDVLINNAQRFPDGDYFEDKSNEVFDQVLVSGLKGTFWTMQEVFPHMRASGGGSIINLASISGYNGIEGRLEYNATKEAIRGLTRTAAREWGLFGIRVNCLAPAGLSEGAVAFSKVDPERFQRLQQAIPMRHSGDPEEEIGGAALFLASDDSKFVTGITLDVDGGLHIAGTPGFARE
jgi:NAD(P)-dependent dehydrogenase (short-subunit alcohol dehydrogenase family)